MSKKIQPVIFMLLIGLLLAACSGGVAPAPAPEADTPAEVDAPAEKEAVTVGFAAMSSGWPWFASFINGYEAQCKEMGWSCTTLSADGDVSKQLGQIEDLISSRVDYLIIGPLDAKATTPGIKKAHEAGIPVIIIANLPDEEAYPYITAIRVPDDREMGQGSAELMVEALGGAGKIVVIDGLPGQPAVTLRWEAMDKVWNEAGVEVLASQPADWDATKAIAVTEDLLTRFPDADGVFSLDGAMTPGVLQVVKETGYKGPVVGLGGTETELAAIREGALFGTTCMSPGQNAAAVAEVINSLEAGDEVEQFLIVRTPKTTKANVDSCPGDW